MRQHFRAAAGAAAILALSLAGCSKPKLDAAGAGRVFLDEVVQGQTDKAYAEAAFGFQAQQSAQTFATSTREMGLTGAAFALEPDVDAEPKTARFNVKVTPRERPPYSLVLTLQQDAGTWRVFSLKSPRSTRTGVSANHFGVVGRPASFNEATTRKLPDDAGIKTLVHDSMQLFANAIATRSFKEFFDNVAVGWQSQLTEKQLAAAFASFIEKDVNLKGISEVEPVLETPAQINADGLLTMAGYYPTKPYRVHFALKYSYELPEWKLFGLDVYLKKADEETGAPAEEKKE